MCSLSKSKINTRLVSLAASYLSAALLRKSSSSCDDESSDSSDDEEEDNPNPIFSSNRKGINRGKINYHTSLAIKTSAVENLKGSDPKMESIVKVLDENNKKKTETGGKPEEESGDDDDVDDTTNPQIYYVLTSFKIV